MDQKTKAAKLSAINEKSLRENILVPLLSRMGLKAVTLYHGARERGKDIICFDYDRFGAREYLAVVAKATELDGSVSSSESLREILYQVEQCFDVPYEDLFGMSRITMDRVWVITSHRIVPGAADSVFDNLTKRNLSKLVRFISGENLVQLIDQHYPAYWDNDLDPVDVINEQKNRLASFCRQLLLSLGGDRADIESTMNQIIQSSSPPVVTLTQDKTLRRVNPYNVEVDSIAPAYSHDFYSTVCGLIKDTYFKTKEDIYFSMFDVQDIIEHYEAVVKKTDPRELVETFRKKLADDYPFYNASHGRANDAMNNLQYLDDGLNDIDCLCQKLSKINKLEWATSLVDSVRDLEDEIKAFLVGVDKTSFTLYWRIETHEGSGKLILDYEYREDPKGCFSTEHKVDVEYFSWGQKRTRLITVKDITDDVQYKLREHFDQLVVHLEAEE